MTFRCDDCGNEVDEDEPNQMGCSECGENWSGDDGRNCPSCGRFGHLCDPSEVNE